MPIDSTADLLFRIGANSDDAEANIQRFRSIMGKSLGDLSGEFSGWSTKVLGDLSTVQGAMIATGAALLAAVVAAGTAAVESAGHYADYVEAVERGSRATGISTEQMSGLKFMAEETGTSYDSLVTGLTRFTTTVVKAAGGAQAQAAAFEKLGISHEQVMAGEKDLMPLLELVAERFKGLGSQVDRTAVARELFSRGGTGLVKMLSLGSEGIKEFEKEAAKLGLTVHTQDVVAMEEFRQTSRETHAQMDALGNEIGKYTLPMMRNLKVGVLTVAIALKDLPHAIHGDFWATLKKDLGEAGDHMRQLASALAHLPEGGEALGGLGDGAEKAKKSFTGLSDLLEEIREKTMGTAGEEGRLAAEIQHLQVELGKAAAEFRTLQASGDLASESAKQQAAALAALPAAIAKLQAALKKLHDDKGAADVEKTGTELREAILRQGQQTLATRAELLTQETQQRREAMQRDHTDTVENLALLDGLYKAGLGKIINDGLAGIAKAGQDIQTELLAQGEQTFETKRQQINREIDQEIAAMRTKETLTAANAAGIEALRKERLAKIDAEEKAAGDTELARLQQQLLRIDREHMTAAERIAAEYQADLAKYVATEEKKSLATAVGEAQRAQIRTQFAAIRKGLLDKEQADLQGLQNSTGWQGVFGAKFAEMIRGNEELLKRWQSSTDQSTMMVQVSLESLKEMGQKTFDELAQGMGANIASALVYQKSIGQAMEAMVKSTLEGLSSQALVYAIFSLALGFTDLAMQDYPGADAAFTAAAIWGSVGAAAGVAGRFVPGGGSGGAGGAGTGAGASGSGTPGVGQYGSQTAARQSDMQSVPGPGAPAASGPHVTVNIQGHVIGTSGVGELCSMINDAVVNSGHPLTATNTLTGMQVNQ